MIFNGFARLSRNECFIYRENQIIQLIIICAATDESSILKSHVVSDSDQRGQTNGGQRINPVRID